MRMSSRLRSLPALVIFVGVGLCFASADERISSLCDVQRTASPGAHFKVRVSGIFTQRLEISELDDPACTFVPYGSTWVELALESKKNQKKLNQLLEKSGRASVVFEGEFYGSPLPDPKLPEGVQKGFPP